MFVYVSDPVASGFAASLARSGGNTTGLLLYEASITGKWLAMLYFMRTAKAISPTLAIELVPRPVETVADIEHAIESFAQAPSPCPFLRVVG